MDTNTTHHAPTKLHGMSARVLRPLVLWFARYHIDPNVFTISSAFIALGAGIAAGFGAWAWAIVLIAINGFCDMTDGELARRLAQHRSAYRKNLGEFLDPLIDRIADTFILTGTLAYAVRQLAITDNWWWPIITVAIGLSIGLNLLSSWIRAKLESLNRKLSESKPLTRATLHIELIIVFVCGWLDVRLLDVPFFIWGMAVICISTIVMAGWRIRKAIARKIWTRL